MIHLSFMDNVKDISSKLIPTAYMEIVEECTAPNLTVPTYDHVSFLCKSVNKKPDCIVDVVRAIRRRLVDDDPAVQSLTIILLGSMIKSCYPPFHIEVANQKGMLRDLELLASDPPKSAAGMRTKELALKLILDLSVWFAGHPDPRCHILTTLANDVRVLSGPNAFEGIRPDAVTKMHLGPSDPSAPPSAGEGNAQRAKREKRPLVDAIPINYPTEALISSMLETCVAFSEYLNNAALLPDGSVQPDEVIVGFQDKVRQDNEYIAILLSSNLDVDRDTLRSVSESQSAVLKRLSTQKPSHKESPKPTVAPTTTNTTAATPATALEQSAPPAATPPVLDDLFTPPAEAPVNATPEAVVEGVSEMARRERSESMDVMPDPSASRNLSVTIPVDTPSVVDNFRATQAAAQHADPVVPKAEEFDPFAVAVPNVPSSPELREPHSTPVDEGPLMTESGSKPEEAAPPVVPSTTNETAQEEAVTPANEGEEAPTTAAAEEAAEVEEQAEAPKEKEPEEAAQPVEEKEEKKEEQPSTRAETGPIDDDDFDAFLSGRSP